MCNTPKKTHKMKYSLILSFLILLNCENSKTKKEDFNVFEIEIPKTWKKIKLKGIDSNVGAIITDKNDTIFYDYGLYSNDLTENPIIIDKKMLSFIKESNKNFDKSEFIVVSNLDSVNIENYKLNNETNAIISNLNCKIINPKKIGNGITGIYFPNVKKSDSKIIKFNLIGTNLNEDNNELLLQAFHTIKFK